MNYDITKKDKICELILATHPKHSNNYNVEALSYVVSFNNLTVPINSIFIKDMIVTYKDKSLEKAEIKNIKSDVKFNITIGKGEQFHLLITDWNEKLSNKLRMQEYA